MLKHAADTEFREISKTFVNNYFCSFILLPLNLSFSTRYRNISVVAKDVFLGDEY